MEERRFHEVTAAGTLRLDWGQNRDCLPSSPQRLCDGKRRSFCDKSAFACSGHVLVPRTGHYPDLARPVKQFPVPGSGHRLVSLITSAPFPRCNSLAPLKQCGECPLCLAAAQDAPAMYVSRNRPRYLPDESGLPLSSVFSHTPLTVKTKARNKISWGQFFGPFYKLSQSNLRK